MVTVKLCGGSPSQRLGLCDESVAYMFDTECAIIFYNWELERQQKRDEYQNEILATALGVTLTRGG